MKKVRIMLMSLMVIAAVGGALAFKAKSPSTLFCSTTDTIGGCTARESQAIKLATPNDTAIPNLFCTNVSGADKPCVTVTEE